MRASIGTGVLLIAAGGICSFAVTFPEDVERYVSMFDVGLVLIWTGVLTLVMQAVMNRPRRSRGTRQTWRQRDYYDYPTMEHDVHRPGWADETRRIPTVRDR